MSTESATASVIPSASRASLIENAAALRAAYDELAARGLKLDLTRGKPSAEQLDLSNALLSLPGEAYTDAAGTDLRNYGGDRGLPELRAIFSELLQIPVPQLLALGNSSLTIMHDIISAALLHGVPGSERPWSKEETVTFLCPVPGYDRHFAITEALGVRMIPVPLNADGPDIAVIRGLLASDPTIKGIWCVPVYSNPTGDVYSEEVVRELVALPAAADFRIFWDNAYAVHHLTEEVPAPIDVLGLAAAAGNPDRVFVFASTSKVTFPGSGVAFFASSEANVAWFLAEQSVRSIGPDKINQLRHALFLKDAAGVAALMAQHRALLEPKFELVDRVFRERLAPHGVGAWTAPKGGYFVALTVSEGVAQRAVELAGQAGIAMTPAGATHPYGDDPQDAVIRIAPTFPALPVLEAALEGFCTALLVAEAEAAEASAASPASR